MSVKIRQEISIINTSYSGTAAVDSSEVVQLDTAQYVNPTYYFEINTGNVSSSSSGISLRRKGTSTDDATITVTLSTDSNKRKRSAAFTPPAGQTEYVFHLPATASGIVVKSARIIVIDNPTTLTSTETQIEIGMNKTGLTSSVSATKVVPDATLTKYWKYTAANWDGTKTFFAEVTYLMASSKSGGTFVLQEDDGSFGTWTDKVTIVSAGVATVATRVRSASFTPTTGRNYRIAYFVASSKSAASIFNAKIIVDQSPVVIDSYDTSHNNAYTSVNPLGARDAVGQSFTGNGSNVSYAAFQLKKVGSPTGAMTANLYAHTGTFGAAGSVPGTLLATSNSIDISTLTTTGTVTTFQFPTPFTTVNTTHYFITIEPSTTDNSNYLQVGEQAGSSTAAGIWAERATPSEAWDSVSGNALVFFVWSAMPTLLEPQYLLLNTADSNATGVQTYQTLWDSTEWSGVTNVYKHAMDSDNASNSAKLRDITAGADITSTVTGANQQISSAITMPATGDEIDTWILNTTGVVGASRILAAVTVSSSVTTTKTQTGISRITATTTYNQLGKGDILKTTTQTQLGLSRITIQTTKTTLGQSRITAITPKTQPGKANIKNNTPQTQLGVSRITVTTLKTQLGKGSIAVQTNRTQTGVSRVTATTLRTQLGKGDVLKTTSQTQTGVARVTITSVKTQPGKARITAATPQTQLGKSRITATTTQAQVGKSRITASATKTQQGVSRITATTVKTTLGKARITAATTQTIPGKARVTATTTQTQAGKSRITITTLKTQQGLARITAAATKTITGAARITASATKTQAGKADILKTTTKTQLGVANILIGTQAKTILGLARIALISTKTQTGKSRITLVTPRTQLGKADVAKKTTKTQLGESRIQVTTNVNYVVDQSQTIGFGFAVGWSTGHEKWYQTFTPSVSNPLGRIDIVAGIEGSPVDSLQVKVYVDNSGTPGSLVEAAGNTIAGNTITGNSCVGQQLSFLFGSTNTLNSGTVYGIEVSRTGSLDSSNFYDIFRNSGGDPDYPGGTLYEYQSGVYVDLARDMVFYQYWQSNPIKGISRITTPVVKTIPGKARITTTVAKTTTGLARVTASTAKTTLGKARITATTLKTQAGQSRITVTTLKTITGKGSIGSTTPKTQTGKSRIQLITARTITGLTRIAGTATRTIPGLARINLITNRTVQGVARVTRVVAQTTVGKARVTITTLQTIAGKARITDTVARTTVGKARITVQVNQIQTGITRITVVTSRTTAGKSRIQISTSQTITGKSRVMQIVPRTITGRSRIALITTHSITGLSRVTITTQRAITGHSRIETTVMHLQTGHSRIETTVIKAITGQSDIIKPITRTIVGYSRVTRVMPRTITGRAHILNKWYQRNPTAYQTGNVKSWELQNRKDFASTADSEWYNRDRKGFSVPR